MAYIDVIDLASYMERTPTELGWLGEFAVQVADEAVRSVTDQDIVYAKDETITLNGTGSSSLLLPQLPVIDVTVVSIRGTELVEDTDYVVDLRTGVLYCLTGSWPKGFQNIAVTYSHGYVEDETVEGAPVPQVVREAALDYAKGIFEAGSAPPPGTSSETTPPYAYTVDAAVAAVAAAGGGLDAMRAKLATYRTVRVG